MFQSLLCTAVAVAAFSNRDRHACHIGFSFTEHVLQCLYQGRVQPRVRPVLSVTQSDHIVKRRIGRNGKPFGFFAGRLGDVQPTATAAVTAAAAASGGTVHHVGRVDERHNATEFVQLGQQDPWASSNGQEPFGHELREQLWVETR